MTLIPVAVVAVLLFAIAFMTRRRFGVLGLALCAGALLSESLTMAGAAVFDTADIRLDVIDNQTLASLLLILTPSLLLLTGGPRYDTKRGAVIGALGYVLLAVLLSIGPLSNSLSVDTATHETLNTIEAYESILIAAAVLVAVVDMALAHRPRFGRAKKH